MESGKGHEGALSVVVTVYTETFSIIETVERVLASGNPALGEILLVVAPKSSAETFRICREVVEKNPLVRMHVQSTGPGVGRALQEGMKLARGEYVAIMSGDLETEPEAVDRMYRKAIETNADVVVGNRWMKGGGFQNYDKFKLVLNWIFQRVFKVIYHTHIGDLTYGFKLLRKHVINAIEWESAFHEIYIETTVKPLKRGYHLEQVPTVWIGRREGESVNTFWRNFGYVKLAWRVQTGR